MLEGLGYQAIILLMGNFQVQNVAEVRAKKWLHNLGYADPFEKKPRSVLTKVAFCLRTDTDGM